MSAPRPLTVESLPTSVLERILVTETCWLWTGAINSDGYGTLVLHGRRDVLAHRATYTAANGPIGEGLVLDHLCHDPQLCIGGRSCIHRRCVRPEHLRAVTNGANAARSTRAARTHCAQGHPLTEENVYHSPHSGRLCRTCRRIAAARERARRGNYSVPPSEVRQWARANGFQITPRGRLTIDVIEAWNQTHPERPFTLPNVHVVAASEVRDWAQANGLDITERGRLPTLVIDAWNQAHPGHPFPTPQPLTAPSATDAEALSVFTKRESVETEVERP